jgi:thermitase
MLRTRCIAAAAALFAVAGIASSAQAGGYAPGQIIVKFKPGVSEAREALVLAHAGASDRLGRVGDVGAELVSVRGDERAVAASLRESSLVEYAEVDKILTAAAVPNDPSFADQYGLDMIDAPEGWGLAGLGAFPSTGGAKLGIIDTGLDRSHPEFQGRVSNCAQSTSLFGVGGGIREGCSDVDGHGTQVAGIAGAKANNGIGVAGVAFNSPLGICRALEDGLGRGSTSNVVNCLSWLRSKGAKVISMSFGGASSTSLHNAIKSAWKNGSGAVLVAAAGNDGGYGTLYPAGYPEVVSVASTDSVDGWGTSNHNADVELAAPGVDILSTALGGGYTSGSGTSAATPYVAGAAAVLRGKFPTETAAAIRNRLATGADDLGEPGRDGYYGFGRVNLCRSLGGTC